MAMFYALMAFCLCGSALAQIPGFGSCPKVKAQSNFDVSKFLGRWYEKSRYIHNFELKAKCNVIDYSSGKNNTIHVINSFINGFTGNADFVEADLYVPDPQHAAKMKVQLPLSPFGAISNYRILGTDYDNYVVIYSCTNYDYVNLKYAWILTRKRIPEASVLAKAYQVLEKNKIKKSNFWKVEQKRCWDKPAA